MSMSLRTVTYTVTPSGLAPYTEQDGGVQGEHCITDVVFGLSAELQAAIAAQEAKGYAVVYRVDGVDGVGGYVPSALLTPSEGTLTYALPRALTGAGGVVRLNLVIAACREQEDGTFEEDMTLYSYTARLRLADSVYGAAGKAEAAEDINGVAVQMEERYCQLAAEVDGKADETALAALDRYVDVVESQLAATTAKSDDTYEYVQQMRVELLDKADKAATVMPSQYSTSPNAPTVVTDEMFYVNMSMNSAHFDLSQAPSHVRFVWNTFAGALYMQNGTEKMSLTVYESGGKVYTGEYVTVTGSGAPTDTSSLFVIDVYKRSATEAVVFVAPEAGVGTYTKPEVDALIDGCGAPAVNYLADPSGYTDSSNAYQLPAGVTVVDVPLGNYVKLFVKAPLNGTATLYFNDAGEGGSELWVASASVNGDPKLTGLLYSHNSMDNFVYGSTIDTYMEHQIYNMTGQFGGRAVVEIANVDGHGDYFTAHVYNYI